MEIIVIEGKDYKRSKRVAEEISWTHLQVKAAKKLAERIEDLQDEMDTSVRAYQSQINNWKYIDQYGNMSTEIQFTSDLRRELEKVER